MTITFARIELLARYTLKDSGATKRWTQQELIDWTNEAQRKAVSFKPDINPAVLSFTLVAGSKQSVPAGYLQPLDFYRNMGVSPGTTPGRAITVVKLQDLKSYEPAWNTTSASAVVIHAMFDEKNPSSFYVYPPQPTSAFGFIEALLSKYPVDIAAGTNLDLADEWESAILDYVLYRGFAKDADNSSVYAQRSVFHFNQFVTALNRKDLVIREKSPNAPSDAMVPK